MAAPPSPPSPLFYRRVRPLARDRHGLLGLPARPDHRFAATANVVPLTVAEFAAAHFHYPIVFTGREAPVPVAVVGLRRDENLFVDDSGAWTEGAYLPAYVRRYPFILIKGREGADYVLALDEASDLLTAHGERPLFADGERTPVVEAAIEICTRFERESAATRAFVEALGEQGLLVERKADARLNTGETIGLTGFRAVEEDRLKGLTPSTLADWRDRGWLGLVYAHLLSAAHWAALVDRAALRRTG